jgi:uncharacterized membrane protein
MIVATLALAGVFVATFLLLYKLGKIGNLSCSIGSCETVNMSKWATFLGAPVAAWGVAFYVFLFLLALVSTTSKYADSLSFAGILLGVSSTGLLFTVYLTYLELFRIHAICQWCVVSAIIVTIIFFVALAEYRELSRATTES